MAPDRPFLYVLNDDGNPVPEPDTGAWGVWFETADRTVAIDRVGEAEISTVFLGIDHAHLSGPPTLFETMVFDGRLDGECWRYSTRQQALVGHAEMVEMLRATQEDVNGT